MSTPSPQDVYANNLQLGRGYPLRSPEPTWDLGAPTPDAMDGLQIGDVGYVDDDGKFNHLFNIYFPLPDKLRHEGFPPYEPTSLDNLNLNLKYHTNAFQNNTVFIRGVERNFTENESSVDELRASYKFTATARKGAILIVPFGATHYELPDQVCLEVFEKLAWRHGLEWCNHASRKSLYLITGMYKARSWALGAFYKGQVGEDVLVRRWDDGTWDWECSFEVDFRGGPCYGEQDYENQTIIIQGFEVSQDLMSIPPQPAFDFDEPPSPFPHANYAFIHEELLLSSHPGRHDRSCCQKVLQAYRLILLRLMSSPGPKVNPEPPSPASDPCASIREIVKETIRDMPHILIDTASGRLCDKMQQAAAFEELPIFNQLQSSNVTQFDYARIRAEVKEFYRYAMMSHKWQRREPTFQTLQKSPVYKLPNLPSFSKLRNFCQLIRTLGFKWAWSDTCCVNQLDKTVQQESIVAMFRWYQGSSLTVVHLVGVMSKSQVKGCLLKSVWNTRGWTYQEYIASEVVQFYTEDWKPYLELEVFNHKESPIVLSEMEQAANFAQEKLVTLAPGVDKAREKLFLASKRQTTRDEDMAYSLFGIFNAALPVIYGEGKPAAVGRLLEHVLTRSRALYRRAATDTLIMVQVREETTLDDLTNGIRTIDMQ